MSLPSENICPLPWISVETAPVGAARPCCLADDYLAMDDGEPLNFKMMTLDEAYKSYPMQKLRQEFREGGRPKTCRRCWAEEDAGRTSKRMHSIIKFKDIIPTIDWNNDMPDQLTFIDLKLGNLCNLKCRICGSWSSSKWAQEDIAQDPNPQKRNTRAYGLLKAGNWPNENKRFWENFDAVLPGIQYIEFTGGEPFMVIQHFEILKKAVALGVAGNISLHYNTNATMVPELEEVWSKFKTVEIAFSIDNVGQRFDYERSGASWKYVEKNIQAFREMAQRHSNIRLQSCTTVNIQNVLYLPETVAWLDKQDFQFVYLNMLHDPKYIAVSHMTPAAKDLVLERLTTNLFLPVYAHEIQSIRNFIENGPGSDGKDFVTFMKKTDQYRGENFAELYPEMAQAMGYNAS
jgi:MoaA/NifB/PqqE/SkfB family radical SAM enzyme